MIKKFDRKKSITYIILGAIVLLFIIILGFSMLLKNDSTSTPLITTKLRAALLTYKRTIIISRATPTPAGSGGTADIAALSPTSQVTNSAISVSAATPTVSSSTTVSATPTDTVLFDAGSTEGTVTPEASIETPADTQTEAPTEAESPTKAEALPASGSVQYPIILFISATVFLFISFLF